MKEKLLLKYKDKCLNVYSQDELKNCSYDFVVVLKDLTESYIDNNILYINYDSFFTHDYLKYPIPAIRKPKKLLTYASGMDILNKVNYGVLAIEAEIPYCVHLNHFIVNQHLYFHCSRQGYKLNGLDHLASYTVVEDLGIHKEAFTNNHHSVCVYGTLKEVKENKKALLDAFLQRYTPGFTKDLNENVINHTMILELSIIHMTAKRHYH